MHPIDPVEYGELRAEVAGLRVDVNRMSVQLERLVAAENQKIGALWLGRMITGVIGAAIVYAAERLVK